MQPPGTELRREYEHAGLPSLRAETHRVRRNTNVERYTMIEPRLDDRCTRKDEPVEYMYGIPQMYWDRTRHEAVGQAALVGRSHPNDSVMDWTEKVTAFQRYPENES